jgi:hypothetical protein
VPQSGNIFANEKGIKAHFTGYHGPLLQKDWTVPRCKLIQRFELVGEGELDEDADVLERREGGVEVKVRMRMRTGEGGMEENAEGKYPEKRGIGRGCRRDRKSRISESKQDELSTVTMKSRQQWTEKDGVRNS